MLLDNQTVVSSDEQIEISAVNDGGVIYSHSGILLMFLLVLMTSISMHLQTVMEKEHSLVHISTCSITD